MGEAHMCLKSALTYQNPEGLKEKQHQWSSFESKKKMKPRGKPALQPRRKQSVIRQPTAFKSERPRFSKQRFASQVDVNNDLSKPVTTHYLPKERESAIAKPHHMIAPGSSRSKLEYKFQDKENSKDIFSFGSAIEDFICVAFVPNRNIFPEIYHPPQTTDTEILQARENLMETIQAFLKEYDHIPPDEKCMALLLAEERFLKIKQAMEEEQNQPEVEQEEHAAKSFTPYGNFSMIDDVKVLQDRENLMKDIQTFLRKFSHIPFGEIPNVLLVAWERFSKIKHAFTDKQYQQEDIQELMSKLLEDVRNINEELSEFINSPSWNHLTFYNDDDDDRDILITSPKIDFLLEEFAAELDFINPILPGIDEDDFDEEEGENDNDILQIEDEILHEKLLRLTTYPNNHINLITQ
ncbi:hypothetical protein Tco_1384338 [Tanacetum coccineum]